MIKHCLNLYASLTYGYPSCLPQKTPAIVAGRLAGIDGASCQASANYAREYTRYFELLLNVF
jgi:hypothetical protein